MVGIYTITNTLNGKVYVGQSRDILKRFSQHRRASSKRTSVVYAAIHKYGLDAFRWEIVQECAVADLDSAEQAWLDWAFASPLGTYNMLPYAQSRKSNKPTEAARANMRLGHAARLAKQTHCPSGHDLADTAVRWGKSKGRYCRTCAFERNRMNQTNPSRRLARAEYRRLHREELAAKQRAYVAQKREAYHRERGK
jgi:group I intron endonuclease